MRASGGFTKYLGEFVDNSLNSHVMLGAVYNVIPEVSLGVGLDFGKAGYSRRTRAGMDALYQYQFGADSDIPRTTWYSTFDVEGRLNLFPRQYLNAYVLLGGGVTLFGPQDYRQDGAQVRPGADVLGAFTVPVGLGLDYFIDRHLAVNLELRHSFLFTDKFDAFPSDEVRDAYNRTGGAVVYTGSASASNDAFSTVSLGLDYFLFEDDDPDGDLLRNEEEEALGSNPYKADTDGDGLNDYLEARLYHTSPLLADTDSDGVPDRAEILIHHTNPLEADTDQDGLSDFAELETTHTNPLEPDSDNDSLPDGREVEIGSNPLAVDTDRDGLSDPVELEVYHTNLLLVDSDADRLSDYEEITAFRSNPLAADTDGDSLTDGEEVLDYHTNPLAKDTDGDGITDYAEVRSMGTDPLQRDTDSDGIPDDVDRCPRLPEIRSRFSNGDGCPDEAVASESSYRRKRVKSMRAPQLISYNRGRGGDENEVLRDGSVFPLSGIRFAEGRDVLQMQESKGALERLVRLLSEYPLMEVELRGYSAFGESANDEELSLGRAKAVHRFLVSRGIRTERLSVRGFIGAGAASNVSALGGTIELRVIKRGPEAGKQQLLTSDEELSLSR